MATSKNSFLMIWAKDFVPDKVMEIPEYFVYCGIFITNRWGKRLVQIAKREFLEVPLYMIIPESPQSAAAHWRVFHSAW